MQVVIVMFVQVYVLLEYLLCRVDLVTQGHIERLHKAAYMYHDIV